MTKNKKTTEKSKIEDLIKNLENYENEKIKSKTKIDIENIKELQDINLEQELNVAETQKNIEIKEESQKDNIKILSIDNLSHKNYRTFLRTGVIPK